MKKYYSVKIKVITTLENGKTKKHSEEYLTYSVSVTDAEASVVNYFKGIPNFDYEVTSVKETRILEFIK